MHGPTSYLLAPSAWGAGEEIPVVDVVQAILFGGLADPSTTTYLDVSLEPDPLTRGWRVRTSDGCIIGAVEEGERQRFEALDRVHAAGHVPTTVAGAQIDTSRGAFLLDVYLPPAQLCVPRNNCPAGRAVLPAGDMYPVDASRGELDAAELAGRSPGQWIVGLDLVRDVVVASLGGRVLGPLGDDDSAALAPLVAGGAACARAHVLEGMVGLDVSAGAPAPLPAIAEERFEPVEAWHVTDFPDGTWGITVERDRAVDEEDRAHPAAGARRVSSPAAGIDFTPTTSFRASAVTYLTEVEKLALLRRQDSHRGSGRHRAG
ncbi:hypothetical protein [Corynebacterium liangguodongii]|uniref:hypothetical protein n=1 Tax=Corynebacterium liangguodongii TaxID=2079535 RepID=UPI0011B2301F|nr:hypothetical protein [Corynebacterium liangguodongii]